MSVPYIQEGSRACWLYPLQSGTPNASGELRPTGTEPGTTKKPALWAVSSTGMLGFYAAWMERALLIPTHEKFYRHNVLIVSGPIVAAARLVNDRVRTSPLPSLYSSCFASSFTLHGSPQNSSFHSPCQRAPTPSLS